MNDFRWEKFVQTAVAVVIIVVVLGLIGSAWKNRGKPNLNSSSYQAVILTNNQQYFGHLKNIGTHYPYLTDIYYAQQGGDGALNLVKMGREPHGPEDTMYLNWKNVLYWQTMKNDSNVIRGIIQEKAQRAAQQPTP